MDLALSPEINKVDDEEPRIIKDTAVVITVTAKTIRNNKITRANPPELFFFILKMRLKRNLQFSPNPLPKSDFAIQILF